MNSQKKVSAFVLWVVFFCYSCSAAIIFQKVLLPIISPETAGTSLLPNDATYFHQIAAKLAADIRELGWGQWHIFPAVGASGNVGILALVYAVLGADPAYIVPINAAMHALSGVLIYKISQELATHESIGFYAGIIASTLFVVFPSALSWYGQNHKDVYAIVGVLLIFLGLIRAIDLRSHSLKTLGLITLTLFLGIFLLGIVRPYSLKLMTLAISLMILIVVLVSLAKRNFQTNFKLIIYLVFIVITLGSTVKFLGGIENSQVGNTYANFNLANLKSTLGYSWSWQNSGWLPHYIEGQIETTARTRVGLIKYGIDEKAGSMIDIHQAPQNVSEVLLYLPRSLQIGAFAPFASDWFDKISATRLVAAAEMLVYYICLPGILLLLFYNRSPKVLLTIYLACVFLAIHGFAIANLGTLYRLRYSYFFILLMLGVLGWLTWIHRSGKFDHWFKHAEKQLNSMVTSNHRLSAAEYAGRKTTIGSSALVMLLTLVCFLGFFARDIMMANAYGFGAELDYFFVALMIPMFLVTVLAMPLGSAFVPFYLGLKERFSDADLKDMVRALATLATWSLLIGCLFVLLVSTWTYEKYYSGLKTENIMLLHQLSATALPLLLFSGAMILGNALLNANGKTVFTSSAQLIVPAIAILSLVLYGKEYGVLAVLYGMVAGQILNLLIVQSKLSRYKTSVMPRFKVTYRNEFSTLFKQYWPLVGSAVFVGVANPIATFLAMSLSDGAVSVFNLGSKVVLFMTGLLGAVVTTVMLPYFSKMVAKNYLFDVRRELSFFLLSATFIAVPLSVGIYFYSGLIVDIMLAGGDFSAESKEQVMRVMKYSIVQLPFFVCNALLLRFAISTRHVLSIFVISILGLGVNVLASLFLMRHMGVGGIALGGSIAMIVSSVLLSLVLVRRWHINLLDLVVIFLNWVIFITMLVAVHFQNSPSIYILLVAYAVLMFGYFRALLPISFVRIGKDSI